MLAAFFFVYGVVIRANKVSAGKELPNSLFRGKLQTRKPLPPDGYLRREAVLTTGKATVRCGMGGHAVVKDGQIVLNAEPSGLDRVGNGQKKFFQSVRIRKVAGSIPVESTMTEQAV